MNGKVSSTIRIIDSLAEITRHHDRHVVEKSLLKTIDDLLPGGKSRLYRVEVSVDGEIEVSLLAFSESGYLDSLDANRSLREQACDLTRQVVSSGKTLTADRDGQSGLIDTFYPAFDAENHIFALLIHSNPEVQSAEQQLIHGILKVYSNYLSLIEKTQRDKLTGLFNRETLDSELTKLLIGGVGRPKLKPVSDERRKSAGGQCAYVGVMDVDHFKDINDRFGHLYGDEILILVSRLIESNFFRDGDKVFRYGGEEFVVVLNAIDDESAGLAFERFRLAVEQHRFTQIEDLTVSIGFVRVEDQQTPADIIGEADKALYYAKDHGRNRVCSYDRLLALGKIRRVERVEEGDIELF